MPFVAFNLQKIRCLSNLGFRAAAGVLRPVLRLNYCCSLGDSASRWLPAEEKWGAGEEFITLYFEKRNTNG
jgi:hypothetical protein